MLPAPDTTKARTFSLQEVKAQIDASILRYMSLSMRIAFIGGALFFIARGLLPDPNPQLRDARLISGFGIIAVALTSALISKLWSARIASAFFASCAVLIGYGMALWVGTGTAAAGAVIPAASIVIIGFVLGPSACVIATRVAIAGVMVLLSAEWWGFIPGALPNNKPPAGAYAVVLIIVFMLVGSTVAHFSRLFWNAMNALENARLELQAKVDMQDRTQSELIESKQRMSALLDHSPMSVLIFEKDSGRLHYANRYALQSHKAKRPAELEQHCLFTQAPYSSEDLLHHIKLVLEEGTQELQWRSQDTQGESIWWAIKLDMLTIEDTQYVVSFGHDITQRLVAEQALIDHRESLEEQIRARTAEVLVQQHRLEAVIEALPVSLSIKDKDGHYQLSNRLFEEASGLSKSSLMGNTADELFPPAMAEQIREHDTSLFNGTEMVRYENSRMRRDGVRRDHLVTKVPLLDATGQPEAILTLAVDISDQKNMQRELASAKNEAERLGTVKTEFLANMSHEIRTPLHGVLGLAQLGQKLPSGDPQVQHVLDRITRSGRHLLGVINDILDFSKIDAGMLIVDSAPMDPRQVAEDAVAMVDERAQVKGLKLSLVCEAVPKAVMGDALRIRQILINLLSNGVKFTDTGEVTLTLSVHDNHLHYAIRDTGIGMHQDTQERVFSPFEQADGSTSRRFGGTGLGLSISRKLARVMQGDIRLHSALNEGATFTLALPLMEADAAQLPEAASPSATTPSDSDNEAPQLTGLRILAADDVEINRDIVTGLLTQQQATVFCAENGKQAIHMLRQQGLGYFDIVLMDVQMPVMNGLQATELIHMIEPDLPVVALTAHAMAEERQRCTDAGMIGHLAKPFEAEDMMRLILRYSRRVPSQPDATPTKTEVAQALAPPELSAQQIDLAGALKRCGGKEALLRKLITRFSDEQADFASRCRQLMTEDMDQARRAAHMLKGTAGNLGLPLLSQQAGELENALLAADTGAIEPTLTALALTLAQHITLLGVWLSEPVPA
ncbi:MAG: ATP-binding protein [Aquabacterium sp.]|nr:ATP-binding protein [Aquabacterium sp.]